MTSIRDFLAKSYFARVGGADAELRHRKGSKHFSKYFSSEVDNVWPRVLYRFVHSAPWRYWDPNVIESSLEVLENSVERTVSAISAWSREIGIGFDNLLRKSATSDCEESLGLDTAHDILRLSTEFHPEYLRCAQHIFANLITIYWAILKKGPVQGNFNIPSATARIKTKGFDLLLSGYDDRIRNAIAHGDVVFKGVGIQYGEQKAGYELSSLDFLSKFDSLWRTSNSLAIAILLFIARNKPRIETIQSLTLPPSIITLLAAGSIERYGLNVLGAVESDLPHTGKQLHIAIRTTFRSREMVLFDSARIAMYLLENGALSYSRYLFGIDCGKAVSSLVIVLPERLSKLLQQQASFDHINEIFDKTQLLWYDESKLFSKFRVRKLIFSSYFRLAWEDFKIELQKAGLWRGVGRFRIRKTENISTGCVPRLRVTAVLQYPFDADDKELIKEIVHSIIKKVSKNWIYTKTSEFERGWGWFGRPKYVLVSLYKIDGTLRWLGAGGWQGGNLLVTAEKIYSSKKSPILVTKPEEIWKGIRFRYAMDIQAYRKTLVEITKLINEKSR